MKMRKIFYIVVLATFMLTACGKETTKEKKSQVETNKLDDKKQDETVDDAGQNVNDEQETIETETDDDSQKGDEQAATTTDNKDADKSSNTKTENNTDEQTSTNGKTPGENTSLSGTTTQKPTTGSSTTQQPSNGSNNTGSSTTTKKPVKRVSEEVKSAVVPYKYGITKYDVITNNYTLYSDGSKELLDSWSYTVYDSTNYSATDSQLQAEADANASKYLSYYQEVLRLVNEIRAEAGVAPMTLDTTLCKAASMRALEMDYDNEMSHTRPNGEDCWTVLDFYKASYTTCGENIAAGQTTPAQVVNDWKNSPGHYKNMINASFTKLGVGYSAMGIGDYGHYWCQLFSN